MDVYVPARIYDRICRESDRTDTPIELLVEDALDAWLTSREPPAVPHQHRLEDGCQWDGLAWECAWTRGQA